jgi:plastocyanin
MRMLKRGTRTARNSIVAALALGGALLAAGPASAAQVQAVDNSYPGGTFTMDQGELLQLQNTGPVNDHDVWSRLDGPDGKKLFISPDIHPGATTTVAGTQYLTTGTYQFFCNLHPFEMSGTLSVGPAGAPAARPDIEVTVVGSKLDKVASKGKLPVKVQALTRSDDVSLELKLGKAVLASKSNLDLAAGQTQKITLKLSKAGKSKLAAKSKATVKLTGTVPFGSPDTAKKKLT